MAGLIIAVGPIITDTFASQIVQAAMFGLYSGSMVPLSSLIVIELLGIEEMGQGFGVLCLFQGVGFLMGPPCAGKCIVFMCFNFCYSLFLLMLSIQNRKNVF